MRLELLTPIEPAPTLHLELEATTAIFVVGDDAQWTARDKERVDWLYIALGDAMEYAARVLFGRGPPAAAGKDLVIRLDTREPLTGDALRTLEYTRESFLRSKVRLEWRVLGHGEGGEQKIPPLEEAAVVHESRSSASTGSEPVGTREPAVGTHATCRLDELSSAHGIAADERVTVMLQKLARVNKAFDDMPPRRQDIAAPEKDCRAIPVVSGPARALTPMLAARFAYAGTWRRASPLGGDWLALSDMAKLPSIELQILRLLMEEGTHLRIASFNESELSVFGMAQTEHTYLIWSGRAEPEVAVVTYAEEYRFDDFLAFVKWCVTKKRTIATRLSK